MDIINQDNNRIVLTDTKPSEKVPYELDGEPCSLYKLVVGEPGWAVSRINYSVDRIAELKQEVTHWIDRYQKATDEAFAANQVIVEYQSRVVELEQELAIGVNVIRDYEEELTEVKQVEKRYETQNVRLIKETASLKEQLTEVKAHNALLLEDKKASPAIIAGYRDYNTSLIEQLNNVSVDYRASIEIRDKLKEQIRIRGDRMETMYQWVRNSLYSWVNDSYAGVYPAETWGEWFDDDGKVL